MEFIDITEHKKTTPGEYIYHTPSNEIVMCGSFNRRRNQIRALARGKMIEDKIENFKKIVLSPEEQRDRAASRCKGCGS